MADNGMQFALSLHQMHEDLTELTNNVERGRKTWKHQSLDAEKKYTDAESLMNRAKTKYDSLAEDYDRAKTGDVKGSRKFIKGPKSAAQYEEDVLRKLQAADTDYADKVAAAKSQRQDLTQSYRPRASKAIQELINECDSGLTLQLQKFATFNEKLLLGNGILITPLPSENASNRSLREIMGDIDNEKDLHHYILAQKSRVPPRAAEIQYVKHPLLAPKQQSTPAPAPAPAPVQTQPSAQSQPINPPTSSFSTFPSGQTTGQGQGQNLPPVPQKDDHFMSSGSGPASPYGADGQNGRPHDYSNTQSPIRSPSYPPQQLEQKRSFNDPPYPMGGPNDNRLPSPNRAGPPLQMPYNNGGPPSSAALPPSAGGAVIPSPQSTGPPTHPVFGVTLEELFARDGSAVPMVVYQCMQAVDVFGLSVEGIYRQNGTAAHISQLKASFDHDARSIDFRNPAAFHHDVNSVAGLLKLFFRDLPDPLLTRERYGEWLAAGRIEDDVVRRDTLHAIINGLPDANYATLRALVLVSFPCV